MGWTRFLCVLTSVAVAAGCQLFASPLPTPHQPSQAGVIETVVWDNPPDTVTLTLSDGKTLQAVHSKFGLPQHGNVPEKGMLLLSGTVDKTAWWLALPKATAECWSAYPGASEQYVVVDLGTSILFPDGLELPKAQGFAASVAPHEHDGHRSWGYSDVTRFCANGRGEIVYADEDWRS